MEHHLDFSRKHSAMLQSIHENNLYRNIYHCLLATHIINYVVFDLLVVCDIMATKLTMNNVTLSHKGEASTGVKWDQICFTYEQYSVNAILCLPHMLH